MLKNGTLASPATARASKATIYRRWPSKAELVLAAFIEGVRQVAVPPNTGTLRGDLLRLGELVCQEAGAHASTLRAVLVEVSRNPALNDAMKQFLEQRKALINRVLRQAVDRGEIDEQGTDRNACWLLERSSQSGLIFATAPERFYGRLTAFLHLGAY